MAHNWKRQASVAYGCALTRLALNFYLYFEELPETYEDGAGNQKALDEQYMELMGDFLSGEDPEILEKISSFRSRVQDEMRLVMAYSDGFQIYEYALNRVERRFKKCSPLEVEEEAFVGNLMRYLASAEDTAIQNQRIQTIVGQLPVRFTRQKYFGIVHDALTSYIGSDRAGLEDMMYLMKGGSMAGLVGQNREEYGKIEKIFRELRNLSFKDLDKDSYENAVDRAGLAGEMLIGLTEHCVNLQEMVNDLYILCLTRQDAVRDASDEEYGMEILRGLWEQYSQKSRDIPQKLEDLLPHLEGIQEEYYEKYQRLDFHREEERSAAGEKGDTARLGELVDRLMSTSTFASLEEEGQRGSVTREDVEAAADQFFAELGPVFASSQKPVIRAIMAMTLSYLPVFFNSPEEIRKYIRDSLGCCTDQAEKEACMDLLMQIMESDGYELV